MFLKSISLHSLRDSSRTKTLRATTAPWKTLGLTLRHHSDAPILSAEFCRSFRPCDTGPYAQPTQASLTPHSRTPRSRSSQPTLANRAPHARAPRRQQVSMPCLSSSLDVCDPVLGQCLNRQGSCDLDEYVKEMFRV